MDDSQILDVWGAGRADPAARPLLMLAAARPELPAEDLAGLPVGRCNELLLRDRQMTFGDQLEGDVVCPDCGDRLEIAVALPDLLAAGHESPIDPNPQPEVIHNPLRPAISSPSADRMASGPPPGIGWGLPTQPSGVADREAFFGGGTLPAASGVGAAGTVRVGDVEVCFRLPAHADLLAASAATDAGAAARILLERCVLAANRGGEPVTDLPAEVVDALDIALAQHDPHADLRLATTCATCGHAFELAVDPAGLYWAELSEHARRLLVDIHRLAAAYGWSEREILTIDPARREAYLELVG
jgi:hypothetical protein